MVLHLAFFISGVVITSNTLNLASTCSPSINISEWLLLHYKVYSQCFCTRGLNSVSGSAGGLTTMCDIRNPALSPTPNSVNTEKLSTFHFICTCTFYCFYSFSLCCLWSTLFLSYYQLVRQLWSTLNYINLYEMCYINHVWLIDSCENSLLVRHIHLTVL